MGESFLLASEGLRDPWQPFASTLAGAFGYGENRIIGWHVGWWGALGLILAFLPYFPRSKHLHLFGAPAKFTLERRHDDLSKVPRGALEPIDFEDESLRAVRGGEVRRLPHDPTPRPLRLHPVQPLHQRLPRQRHGQGALARRHRD